MRILVELPTWLGDAIMTTPAIENLVIFFNQPEIILIGSKTSIEVLKYHPNVSKSYILEKNYINLYKSIKNLEEIDVFFSFRSSFRSKLLKFFISAKSKYQYDKNHFVNGHQVEKYNSFFNISVKQKAPPQGLVLHNQKKILKSSSNHKKKLMGINPGASYGRAKQWYPKEFAKVAIKLSNQYDIIIFGGDQEKDICNDIEGYLKDYGVNNYKNLVSKTSINQLMVEIQSLDLFITGDSGPMHLAGAYQIPTVSIFGPTKDQETSQWKNKKSKIVKKNLECQPCMQRICPLGHHDCMKKINAEDVLFAVEKLTNI